MAKIDFAVGMKSPKMKGVAKKSVVSTRVGYRVERDRFTSDRQKWKLDVHLSRASHPLQI
jgi:hypothetical protein